MTDLKQQEARAIAHVHALGGDALPDEHYSPDLTAWSSISGMMSGAHYLEKLPFVRGSFSEPLAMTIDHCTTQPGRTAVQCRSTGTLGNGKAYSNDYHILVEFDDAGRIRHVREYMDSKRAEEILMPYLRERIAKAQAAA